MLLRTVALLCCAILGTVACSSEERAPVDQGQEVVTRTVTETVAAQESLETTPEAVAPETTSEPISPAPAEITSDSPDLVVGDTAVTAAGNEITVHSFEYVPPAEFFQPEPG